jgi:hypothetical protein
MQKGFPKKAVHRTFSRALLDEFLSELEKLEKLEKPEARPDWLYWADTPANRALFDKALREQAATRYPIPPTHEQT